METEKQGELFAIEKEVTIRLLEGGIVVLLVDGEREIVADIAAAQFRVGECLGIKESKRSRGNMSNEDAIARLQELYAPGADITTAMITKLPGIGEHRAGVIVKKMQDDGLLVVAGSGELQMK